MNALIAGLLAGLLLAGFVRPRWWLSLVPVAVTIGLGAYRLSLPRSSSADAVAFLGIVLLTVAMEGALVGGALARAGFERSQSRRARARAALHAARGIALAGLTFVVAAIVVARATSGLALLLSAAGGRGRARQSLARPVSPAPAPAAPAAPAAHADRAGGAGSRHRGTARTATRRDPARSRSGSHTRQALRSPGGAASAGRSG